MIFKDPFRMIYELSKIVITRAEKSRLYMHGEVEQSY